MSTNVYVLRCENNMRYVGKAADIQKRFQEHNFKRNISTKLYALFKLIYYEAYENKLDAIEREKMLKHKGSSIRHLKKRIKRSLND